MNSVGVSVLDLEISRPGGSSGENDSVRLLSNGRGIDIDSDVGVGDEVLRREKREEESSAGERDEVEEKDTRTHDSLSSHEIDSSLNDCLIELHIGDSVHEPVEEETKDRGSERELRRRDVGVFNAQSSESIVSVVDSDGVTSLVQLIG